MRTSEPTTGRSDPVRSVVIDKAGSFDRLRIEAGHPVAPGPGDVVIDVRAIGVNYADCTVRMGLYASAKEFVGWPITPGFEVSGEVAAVGDGVEGLQIGQRVMAVTRFGGYTTRLTVDQRQVFAMPDSLGFEQAAGFSAVYLTAYFALFELAHPRPGSRVLIHSAAGGVGGCLVQLSKLAGCEVTGVVGRSHKIETARAHGADHVIDKSSEALWPAAERIAPERYDVIADANGVATLRDSYEHLRPGGKLVVYGFHTMMPKKGGRPNWIKLARDYLRTPRFNPLDMTNDGVSVLAFNLSYMFDRLEILGEAMPRLLGWLEEGKIEAPPVTTYAFDRVADAHRDLESAQTVGKLILVT